MTVQNKTPQCCGETLKVAKNQDGSFSYACPKCGKMAAGDTPAIAAKIWAENALKKQKQDTADFTSDLPAVIPTSPVAFKNWVQQNLKELIKDSALWIDQGQKDRPATRRMINKNVEYILNNKNIAYAWETEEGQKSIIAEFKESLWYGATMPEMGCLIPYSPIVEFNPDVEALIFALTTGKNAPFVYIHILEVYENDKYKCYYDDKGNFIYQPENIPIGHGGELIGIVVRGLSKISGLTEGKKYDVANLVQKAEKHSKSYKYYLTDMNLIEQMRVEGKLQFEGSREYFIKNIKKKNGETWEKKIYLDEIQNPYIGADRTEMLRKTAGKNFCRPYMKVRNAAEAASEWSGEEEQEIPAPDRVLNRAKEQFGNPEQFTESAPDIKDAEIIEEEKEEVRI